MKRFFLKGTDNEVQFGDVIETDTTKDLEDGKTHWYHLECTFSPALVDTLLEHDIIEVEDDEQEEEEEEVEDIKEEILSYLDSIEKSTKSMSERIDMLEEAVLTLQKEALKNKKKSKKA